MQIRLARLVPHPDTCSHHPQTVREKLRRHIDATGLYPPLIVRSLTGSRKFAAERHRFQILDGQLRFKILQDLGRTHAEVVNFGPLTDRQAEVFLLTLNFLRSPGDPERRGRLVKSHLADNDLSVSDLQPLLPESGVTLRRLLDLAESQPRLTDPKRLRAQPKPFAVYLTSDQHAVVERALRQIKQGVSVATTAQALACLARNFLGAA